MAIIYQKLGNKNWLYYDPQDDNTTLTIYNKVDINSQITQLTDALAQLPAPKTNAQKLAWFEANYPGSEQAREATRITLLLEQLNDIKAHLV
jgi:hypothetical protein